MCGAIIAGSASKILPSLRSAFQVVLPKPQYLGSEIQDCNLVTKGKEGAMNDLIIPPQLFKRFPRFEAIIKQAAGLFNSINSFEDVETYLPGLVVELLPSDGSLIHQAGFIHRKYGHAGRVFGVGASGRVERYATGLSITGDVAFFELIV